MTQPSPRILTLLAPAKINLYLHVTGRLDNGYHTLDSLIAFADIGDEIRLEHASEFSFHVDGPFSSAFRDKELDSSPGSANLAVRAAWALSRLAQKNLDVKITLTKNLPLGAGIGGGSSDAATVIWGLLDHWGLSPSLDGLDKLLLSLGADVPVCLQCRTARVQGIGDIMQAVPDFPEIPIVIVNPGKPCNTAKIFSIFHRDFREPVSVPPGFETPQSVASFLLNTSNDLTSAAQDTLPVIGNIVQTISRSEGCKIARMSGSGSSCFGLYDTPAQAEAAAKAIKDDNPDWWVQRGWLGRPERY